VRRPLRPFRAREETRESRGMPHLFLNTGRQNDPKPKISDLRGTLNFSNSRTILRQRCGQCSRTLGHAGLFPIPDLTTQISRVGQEMSWFARTAQDPDWLSDLRNRRGIALLSRVSSRAQSREWKPLRVAGGVTLPDVPLLFGLRCRNVADRLANLCCFSSLYWQRRRTLVREPK